MSAALRVSWTFFTALPLQRWLGGTGVLLCALLAIAGLAVQQPLWMLGLLVLLVFAVFPALFASAAVFRALSAPRANQLLPRFRARMLAAVALFMFGLVASFALFLLALASLGGRAMPVEPLVFAFMFGTATFMLMFLQFGDWRWMWLWLGSALAFSALAVTPVTRSILAATPVWSWLAAALAAWIAFGAWYLRARRIKPLVLVPQPRVSAWSRVGAEQSFTRATALRALVTARPPRANTTLLWMVIGVVLGAAVIAAALTPAARVFSFTSFVWPLTTMIGLWSKSTSIVHRSRLLWLRMPGPRAAVRREIERALLRNFGGAVLLLLGAAAVYASPLVATPPREVIAGLVLAAGAGLFGSYAALAAIPGNVVHITAFALVILAQLGMLARPSPALTDVVLVTAVELVGAVVFWAFARARWRRVDWLRLRPLAQANLFRDA